MLLAQAVSNNALWCDAVCRAHGHAGEFLDGIWITRAVAPPFYPNAVTLTDAHATDAQVQAIRRLLAAQIPGAWAVKDSYHALDLAPLGFRPLFDATWIGRDGPQPLPDADMHGMRWSVVQNPVELALWEAAWRGTAANADDQATTRIFLPALLDDANIAFLAAYHNDRIVAGTIANRTGEVVGISNVFVSAQDEMHWRAACVTAIMQRFPALPLVGYESGSDLAAFRALGFAELGSLRIWARSDE